MKYTGLTKQETSCLEFKNEWESDCTNGWLVNEKFGCAIQLSDKQIKEYQEQYYKRYDIFEQHLKEDL